LETVEQNFSKRWEKVAARKRQGAGVRHPWRKFSYYKKRTGGRSEKVPKLAGSQGKVGYREGGGVEVEGKRMIIGN